MNNSNTESAVKVAVRERPTEYSTFQISRTSSSVIQYHSNANILIVDEKPFAFDYVFGPEVNQEQVFDSLIKPLWHQFELGFNCTALAYGQTGTGKSYSMGLELNNFNGCHLGIVPRCLQQLFVADTENSENNEDLEKEISLSFIEIYNEKVFDLLAENCNEPIMSKGSKYPGGIRKRITDLQDCYDTLILGNKNRHVRPTKMNAQSSRSHAVFTIHLTTKRRYVNGNNVTITSCMNLVDLAGSESVRRTGHIGMAMSEGVNINQGLLSFGKVLHAMKMGFKVIPYRDSVLSLVLQGSLNPNSYLTLLACISSQRQNLGATLSTLRFAQNAKQLKNFPKINDISTNIKADNKFKKRNMEINTPKPKPPRFVVNHTFSTPQKEIRRLNKCNITDNCSSRNRISNSKEMTHFDRDSSFDFGIISNVSTSTVADVPVPVNKKLDRSFNTAINEYMSNFESKMANLFMEVIQTNLPKLNNRKSKSGEYWGEQFSEGTRDDLKSLMREVLAESCATLQTDGASSFITNASRKTLPMNSELTSNPQTLCTSNEVFKVPKAKIDQSQGNLFPPSFNMDDKSNMKQPRRSMRILHKQELICLNPKPDDACNLSPARVAARRRRTTIVDTYATTSSKQIASDHVNDYYNCLYSKKKMSRTKYRAAVLNLLNKGTVKELQILPQVGHKTAMKIVLHRNQNGGFKSLKQLQKLPIWYGGSWNRFTSENLLT